MNDFYVYAHYKSGETIPFYIGKGRDKRAWKSSGRNSHWRNIVNKYGYEVKILESGLTEDIAFKRETELIGEYGRSNLVNLTDGGEGQSGCKFTDERIKNMSLASKKRFDDPKFKEKMSKISRDRMSSNSFRQELSKLTKEKFAIDSEYRMRHKLAVQSKCSKLYDGFISPDGIIYSPVFNLTEFCNVHNLTQQNMDKLAKGYRRHHKGWTRYIITEKV